jgi:hypothetical protein
MRVVVQRVKQAAVRVGEAGSHRPRFCCTRRSVTRMGNRICLMADKAVRCASSRTRA